MVNFIQNVDEGSMEAYNCEVFLLETRPAYTKQIAKKITKFASGNWGWVIERAYIKMANLPLGRIYT